MQQKKFIEVQTPSGSYLILDLGIETTAKEAIEKAAYAWIATFEGLSYMLKNKHIIMDYGRAVKTIPDSVCVQYGFLPVRGPVPFELAKDDKYACSMTYCIPDRETIDTILDLMCADCSEEEYNAFKRRLDIRHRPEPADPAVRVVAIAQAIDKYYDSGHIALPATVNLLLIEALKRRLPECQTAQS